MDVKRTDIHRKKKKGAIIGAATMVLFMLFMVLLILWGNSQEPLPVGVIPLFIIAGTLVALAGRMREIEALGIVKGTVVQTKNVGKDFMAGMKTLVGGEIVGYTEMLNEARRSRQSVWWMRRR